MPPKQAIPVLIAAGKEWVPVHHMADGLEDPSPSWPQGRPISYYMAAEKDVPIPAPIFLVSVYPDEQGHPLRESDELDGPTIRQPDKVS